MKKVLFILFVFLSIKSVGQSPSIIPLKADSVIIYKSGTGGAELVIRNKTKDTLGYLYNKGNGITEFRSISSASGSTLVTTVAGLRATTSPSENTIYETTDFGTGNWYYDPSDITSTDNTGTILVAGTKRYKRIYSGYLSVQWFGVLPSNTSVQNDAAILYTIGVVSAGSGLYWPRGVYLNTGFHVTKTLNFIGESKYGSIIKNVGTGTDAVTIDANVERGVFSNIGIAGNGTAIFGAGSTTGRGIVFSNNSVIWHFDNVWMRGHGDYFFYADSTGNVNNITISNSELEWGKTGGVHFYQRTSANQINAIVITACNILGFAGNGLELWGQNINVDKSAIQACKKRGIVADGLAGYNSSSLQGLNITNNYFELCDSGFIYMRSYYNYDLSAARYILGATISGNFGVYAKNSVNSGIDESSHALVEIVCPTFYDYTNLQVSSIEYGSNTFTPGPLGDPTTISTIFDAHNVIGYNSTITKSIMDIAYINDYINLGAARVVGIGEGILSATGTPEGVVDGANGSLYLNKSGGTSTLYLKESSPTSKTGWVRYTSPGDTSGFMHKSYSIAETVTGVKTFSDDAIFSSIIRTVTGIYANNSTSGQLPLYHTKASTIGISISALDVNVKTSGNKDVVRIFENFVPPSGTATMNALTVFPTVDQSSGATGITRGIYVTPTLTAPADWRGLQIEGDSGFSIYQTSLLSKNFIGGHTGIGHIASTSTFLGLGNSTAAASSLNIPTGVAPTTPVDGDLWQASNHFYGRLNSTTYQLDQQSIPAGSTGQIQYNSGGVFAASSLFNYDAVNHYLGVGITTPLETIHTIKDAVTGNYLRVDAVNGAAGIQTYAYNGSIASPTATTSGQFIGLWSMRGYGTSLGSAARAYMGGKATQLWTATAQGTQLVFATTPNNSVTSAIALTIDQSSNVGIGQTTPDASALLDIASTTKGFLTPRMTAAQMNAISSPATGLQVYNSDSIALCFYNGAAWLKVGSSSSASGWGLTGNSITAGTNFLGTTNNASLDIYTNSVRTARFDSVGAQLHLLAGVNPMLSMKQKTTNTEVQLRVGVGTGVSNGNFNIYDATASKVRMVMSGASTGFGDILSIPTASKLYVYGGSAGPNIDVRPDSTVYDEGNIEVESSDYEGSSFTGYGIALQYNGNVNTGSFLGYSKKNFGQLRFTGKTNFIHVITNNSLRFATNDLEKMVLDSNGRLGIGSVSPDSALHVVGGLKFVTGRQGAGRVLVSDANGGADWSSISSGLSGTLPATNGGTGTATYTTGDILYASATNTLSKLSIGATGKKLTVVGGIPTWVDSTAVPTVSGVYLPLAGATYTTTTGNGLALTTSTITTGNLVSLASTGTAAGSNTQTVLNIATSGANGTTTQTTWGLDVANTHTGTASSNIAARISASGGSNNYALIVPSGGGSVGIGNSAPASTLDVTGTGNISTSLTTPLLQGGTLTTSPLTLKTTTGVGTTGADIIFQVGNNGATEAMRILNSGKVGIGNTAPVVDLSIGTSLVTNTYRGIAIGSTTLTSAVQVGQSQNNNLTYYWVPNATSSLGIAYLNTSGYNNPIYMDASKLILGSSSGNVGIGIVNPTALLHIKAGTATASTAPLKYTLLSAAINTVAEIGAVEAASNRVYYTDSTATRYIIHAGGTPTIAAGVGAGTSPTISITGIDEDGYISVTTGTLPTLSGVVGTITFSSAYGATPKCVLISPANSNASLLSGVTMVFVDQAGISTTTWAITAGTTALTAATTYKFYYRVMQ